jgi:transcriptional regulator with XRE-family HTH domain
MKNDKLDRLLEGLKTAGVEKGERNRVVAEYTGYSEKTIGNILSGNAQLTTRFIQMVCRVFEINWEWVENGTQPVVIPAGIASIAGFRQMMKHPGGITVIAPPIEGQGIADISTVPKFVNGEPLHKIAGITDDLPPARKNKVTGNTLSITRGIADLSDITPTQEQMAKSAYIQKLSNDMSLLDMEQLFEVADFVGLKLKEQFRKSGK